MAILSREKTKDCWVKLAKNESWKHLLLFSLASWQFRNILLSFQSRNLSWAAENIHWPSEVSRKAFCRSSMVSLDSLVALLAYLLVYSHSWTHLAADVPFFVERQGISPTSWELLLIQKAAAREQHVAIVLPDSLAECTVCGDLKTK